MQQNIYQNNENNEQTIIEKRQFNTDPRETSSESVPHMQLQPQGHRRPWWLPLVLCLLALALVVGIVGLTGNVSFTSTQKTLPTRAFTINGHGSLVINDDSGTFHIHEGTGNQVIVRGSETAYGLVSSFNSIQVQYGQQGNTVTLDANEGWNVLGYNGVEFDITVPANLDVVIHGDSTDADLTNVDGSVNANTDSGDLQLNNVDGPLNLNTSSGDMTVTNEQGAVSAHSDSGNIQINQLTGPVNLSTDSGDITLTRAHISGRDLLETDSGDINFSGTLDQSGSYQMNTSSGDITLTLPASSSFQLSTSTDSGDVNNAFGSQITGNAPHAVLNLKTDSGDINLQKQ